MSIPKGNLQKIYEFTTDPVYWGGRKYTFRIVSRDFTKFGISNTAMMAVRALESIRYKSYTVKCGYQEIALGDYTEALEYYTKHKDYLDRIHRKTKPIIVEPVSTGTTYDGKLYIVLSKAELQDVGFDLPSVYQVLKGNFKHHKGVKFSYFKGKLLNSKLVDIRDGFRVD